MFKTRSTSRGESSPILDRNSQFLGGHCLYGYVHHSLAVNPTWYTGSYFWRIRASICCNPCLPLPKIAFRAFPALQDAKLIYAKLFSKPPVWEKLYHHVDSTLNSPPPRLVHQNLNRELNVLKLRKGCCEVLKKKTWYLADPDVFFLRLGFCLSVSVFGI